MPTPIVETDHAFEFLLAPPPHGHHHLANGLLAASVGLVAAGTVLGLTADATGAGTYAANAGNTGNFTSGAVTTAAPAVAGTYRGQFIAATRFNVYAPDGRFIGAGTTGSAFEAGGLGFTLTAGGTPAVAGDGFTIDVPTTDAGLYTPLDPEATDGAQDTVAICGRTYPDMTSEQPIVVVARDCEVVGDALVWPSGITDANKARAVAALTARGIVVR